MIFDNIKNIYKYNFEKDILRALESEARIASENYPKANIELSDGDFLIPSEYDTQIREKPVFETHKNYIDVMYMVEGCEIIKVKNADKLSCIVAEYNEEKDFMLAEADAYSDICISAGEFVILYPQDAHCSSCALDGKPAKVKKVIGKVKINK